ncbi:PLP-dependent cysteine synthase family protein [Halospeciosus flavus]|uniref:PLP-dependent cysteine synthase family protein n=1 Tax=Halospeciosus flavus TaxID=3032283 RepID=A0ABD5Z5J5_9EURY|nr:pyridoxal-phosphate dependent enzyme [Halospeciosus flavus]
MSGAPVDESTIGRTPLVEVDLDVLPTVYAKLEWFNCYDCGFGGGSVKTRIAKAMLDAAEARDEIRGRTIVEPSSGNTGTALARIGSSRGYDVEIVTPESPSETKIEAIQAAGGRVRRATTYEMMLEQCADLLEANPEQYYRPNQYANPANPGVHAATTGPEIWRQTDGEVTHFVAGAGTGGTVTGVGTALHRRGDVTVHGFEPAEPEHAIDGLKYTRGSRFHDPDVYDESVLDDFFTVSTADAYECARWLRERYADREVRVVDTGQHDAPTVRDHLRVGEEFLVGTSSGAVVAAVERLAAEGAFDADDVVVVPFPDRGDRYRHLPLWEDVL